MKFWVLAVGLLLSAMPSQVQAFGRSIVAGTDRIGACRVVATSGAVTSRTGTASVTLIGPSGISYAGGSQWLLGRRLTGSQISAAAIAQCLGTAVTNLSQNGADAASYTDEDRIGFSFDADGIHYAYSLTGQTGTVWRATRSPAASRSAGFMLRRADNLAANQPGLARFLRGGSCGTFAAQGDSTAGALNGCVSSENVWAEVTGSWSGTGTYSLGTLGAHGFVTPDFLFGGMIQFDDSQEPANNASGSGWLIGPYFAARLAPQSVLVEGRLLFGQSQNRVTQGTNTDRFDTQRLLAQVKATGEVTLGRATLLPNLAVSYVQDHQLAYTNSLLVLVPGQTVDLLQVNAGLDFSAPLPVGSGALELTGGLAGIFSSASGSAMSSPAVQAPGLRARTHLGINYATASGASFRLGTFYDGLGSSTESYGANLSVQMSF